MYLIRRNTPVWLGIPAFFFLYIYPSLLYGTSCGEGQQSFWYRKWWGRDAGQWNIHHFDTSYSSYSSDTSLSPRAYMPPVVVIYDRFTKSNLLGNICFMKRRRRYQDQGRNNSFNFIPFFLLLLPIVIFTKTGHLFFAEGPFVVVTFCPAVYRNEGGRCVEKSHCVFFLVRIFVRDEIENQSYGNNERLWLMSLGPRMDDDAWDRPRGSVFYKYKSNRKIERWLCFPFFFPSSSKNTEEWTYSRFS